MKVAVFTLQNLQSILSALPDPTFVLTRSGRYAAVFGGKDHRHYHDGSGLIGKRMSEVLIAEKASWFAAEIATALASRALHIIEYSLSGSDVQGLRAEGPDETIWFEGRVQALDFPVEGEEAVVWVASNITGKNAAQQKLRHMSETDALTGLYNRRKLLETLDDRLGVFSRDRIPTAVLIFDLDNFKRINDESGHHAGDDVLVEIAGICRRNLRKTDLVARLGGDEFVVVMPGMAQEDAFPIAERLRDLVPVTLRRTLRQESTISAGLSEFWLPDRSSDDVLRRADAGLYMSKRAGRNRISAL